jgi:hypothetical protein
MVRPKRRPSAAISDRLQHVGNHHLAAGAQKALAWPVVWRTSADPKQRACLVCTRAGDSTQVAVSAGQLGLAPMRPSPKARSIQNGCCQADQLRHVPRPPPDAAADPEARVRARQIHPFDTNELASP